MALTEIKHTGGKTLMFMSWVVGVLAAQQVRFNMPGIQWNAI